jgi:DNA repair protein RadC
VTDIRKRSVTELVESFAGRVQPPQAKALIELARRAMQVDKQDDVYGLSTVEWAAKFVADAWEEYGNEP